MTRLSENKTAASTYLLPPEKSARRRRSPKSVRRDSINLFSQKYPKVVVLAFRKLKRTTQRRTSFPREGSEKSMKTSGR